MRNINSASFYFTFQNFIMYHFNTHFVNFTSFTAAVKTHMAQHTLEALNIGVHVMFNGDLKLIL